MNGPRFVSQFTAINAEDIICENAVTKRGGNNDHRHAIKTMVVTTRNVRNVATYFDEEVLC